MTFHRNVLQIDAPSEVERIVESLRYDVRKTLRRYGSVVGISGGVDSSVVLALCARAFGPEKVAAIIMPEKDSDPESEMLAREVAGRFAVTPVLENITPALEGFGCYRRRDEAIRRVFSDYNAAAGYTAKIGLPQNLMDEDTLNVFSLTVIDRAGRERSAPLGAREFLDIMAASNFKQRTRMSILYFHAERNNYAVVGTANKNEHDQGFFVKYGDGGVDIQPVAHLYKTQIYQLARWLDVPRQIVERPSTPDTSSARGTQQEFFFRLPFETMDLLWFAQEHGVPLAEAARVMELNEAQVERAFRDFTRKHRTTNYLRLAPIGMQPEPAAVTA